MAPNTRCILSCDGGGIRGIVTATLLERLEAKLKAVQPDKELRDYFDIIAGTSTGSIIACGVSKGYSASRIRQIYRERGIDIFPRFWQVFKSLISRITFGYSQPIYDGKGLEEVLRDGSIFGEELFKSLPVCTLVTCYDTYNRQAVVFINTEPSAAQIPIWQVCRSSSAAPVAFPAYLLKESNFIAFWKNELQNKGGLGIPIYQGEQVVPLIDGGMFANNPAMCAIANRLIWDDQPSRKDLVVASFGTGQNVKAIGVKEALGWGGLDWASPLKGIPLLDVLFDGSSDAVDYVSKKLLDPEKDYRFQPTLVEDLPAFNAGKENIAKLENAALKYLERSEVDERLSALAKNLIDRSTTL
jgi:patatin-like phospholipase/acyl hydrolase